MFKDDYDYETLVNAEKNTFQPAKPSLIKRVEHGFLIDSKDNKYLDLTSNKDNNPFGYLNINIETKVCFKESEFFRTNKEEELTSQLKSITGLDEFYFFSSVQEIYDPIKKTINTHCNKFKKDKILISSTFKDRELYSIENRDKDYIPLNNESTLKTFFSKTVGAVIVQIAQITESITVAEDDYLQTLKKLCEKYNALLIFDVSMVAPFRLNKNFFNYDTTIKPDILVSSKGLSQGLPFALFGVAQKHALLEETDCSSNVYSLAYDTASALINKYNKVDLAKTVNSLDKKLKELAETHIALVDFYFSGMSIVLILDVSAYEFTKHAFSKGLIIEQLNDFSLMIKPSYNITEEEIDYFIAIFDKIFDEVAVFDRLK